MEHFEVEFISGTYWLRSPSLTKEYASQEAATRAIAEQLAERVRAGCHTVYDLYRVVRVTTTKNTPEWRFEYYQAGRWVKSNNLNLQACEAAAVDKCVEWTKDSGYLYRHILVRDIPGITTRTVI